MIKATGQTGDGTPLLLLGLSGENITRLVAGEPIGFNTIELGMDAIEVGIIYGKTEDALIEQLQGVLKANPTIRRE